ncbi:MAG: STAS domain-containing protein [Candidatus Eremiobacteraeota bacterium]|nr:STAS domain-containing protein [Candidatus Eremiobacteraeota bacterium]MBV8498066.1 STAS domain-containing protein [Candidatus Eremiobacteraeota bacterium]
MSDGESIKTIRLGGELEIGRKDEIRTALQRSGSDRAVLLDLSDVTYADSVALTELLRFCVSSSHDAIPVALVVRTPQFARVVQYAGLAGAFKIFGDRDAALAYLARSDTE